MLRFPIAALALSTLAPPVAVGQSIAISPLAAARAPRPALPRYRDFSSVEVTTGIGLVDVGVAGADFMGLGYAHEGGPIGALEVRALFAGGDGWTFVDRMHLGALLRFAHTAGDSFGALSSYGFAHLMTELAAVYRYALAMDPFGEYQAFVSVYLGVSLSVDDAGLGRGALDTHPAQRERLSRQLDHASLGAVLGGSFDARHEALIMGLDLAVRFHWGIDSPVSHNLMVSIGVRMGVVVDFDDSRRSVPIPRHAQPPEPTIAELRAECRAGGLDGCYQLARGLESGRLRVGRDRLAAERAFSLACKRGHPEACRRAAWSARERGLESLARRLERRRRWLERRARDRSPASSDRSSP